MEVCGDDPGSENGAGREVARPIVDVDNDYVTLGDTDAFRMLYWAAPLRWAEEGVERLFRRAGHPIEEHLTGIDYPIAHVAVDYMLPLRLGAEIEVRTWVARVGRRSVDVVTEVLDSSAAVAVRISRTHVAYKSDSTAPMAEEWLRRIVFDANEN